MSVITDIISRIPLNNYNNIKETIEYISKWLYELNTVSTKNTQKYKNLGNNEYKDLYDMLELHIYKTRFSFTTYETNKKMVIVYFIKYIYDISTSCAKVIYRSYKNNDNDYLTSIINNDKLLHNK